MRKFVSVHVLVPGYWTVLAGHELVETVEREIREVVANATVLRHLEPIEHPSSYADVAPDRR